HRAEGERVAHRERALEVHLHAGRPVRGDGSHEDAPRDDDKQRHHPA
ncbi:hypothetical protein FJSC11DRAFT_4628, partial [Fischerella thermalis JSC-11]